MRREQIVVVKADGRDKDKVFKITEMSADQAERWALRAILALARSGLDIPDGLESTGMAGLASIAVLGAKLFGHLPLAEAQVLMDDMMKCVTFIPTPEKPSIVRAIFPDDIEEIATLVKLRVEVFTLHTGFSAADVLSKLTSLRASARPSTTQTSPAPSEPSSPQDTPSS